MNKIFRLIGAWMAIALTACSGNELELMESLEQPAGERVISVKAYTPNEQTNSRLAFEEHQDGSLALSWTEGDAFTAVIGETKVDFTYNVQTGEFSATLPAGVEMTDETKAYYPAFTDAYSTDFAAQTGGYNSRTTYMEGTYSESTRSFTFVHSTAILKASFTGLPEEAAVTSIRVNAGEYTITIPYTSDLSLSDGIYIYLPSIARHGQVDFSVQTEDNKEYTATQSVNKMTGIETGKLYTATIALTQFVCQLPSSFDFKAAIAPVVENKNVTAIVFETQSEETGGVRIGESIAYAKILSDGTTLKIYTVASEFVFPEACTGLFSGFSNVTSIDWSNHINTSLVTDMNDMFFDCSSLTSLDLSRFDTSNVTGMKAMFYGCSSLTSLDLSNFDTSNVTDMEFMFFGCEKLATLTLGDEFSTSLVTDMSSMFQECNLLASLDLSRFDTSNVTDMKVMFSGCSSLTSLDLSGFNTSKVTNMSSMFSGCHKLTTLTLSENFSTSLVTDMNSMFFNCSELQSLALGSFDTSKVTNMKSMFYDCSSLTSLDLSAFNTSAVTNMKSMFYYCSSLTSLDLSAFNTSEVTDMGFMFSGCTGLSSLTFGDNFDTSKVMSMQYMFSSCNNLTTFTFGANFNTSSVTNMSSMFYYCERLISLNLSAFNTSAVKNMSSMFSGCFALSSLTFGEDFNTSAVTNMNSMFNYCSSLASLDLSGFNTSEVTDMGFMFSYCKGLTSLTFGEYFNTSAVTDMGSMFYCCYNLSSLDLSSFEFASGVNLTNIFLKVASYTSNKPINIYVKTAAYKELLESYNNVDNSVLVVGTP